MPARKPKASRTTRWIELVLLFAATMGAIGAVVNSQYTVSLQSPVRVRWQWPLVFAPREAGEIGAEARRTKFGHG